MNSKPKNIILYLGKINANVKEGIKQLEAYTGEKYRLGLLTSSKKQTILHEDDIDVLIKVNLKDLEKLEEALWEYKDQVIVLNNLFENMMPVYERIIPFFPYLKTPTPRSIHLCNSKLEMRKALKKFAPNTIPKFRMVKSPKPENLDEIIEYIKFPLVIKPASLSKSQLIATCYYKEELEDNLRKTFKKIYTLYKKNSVEQKPVVLVEQMMEGRMYSVDVYINSKGKLYFTPYISIKTGKDIGRDDYFMWSQKVPSNLNDEDLKRANKVVEDGVHALGLRSISAHIELYYIKDKFKIIEIGSRVGGFRKQLLENSFGINHYMNDLLIRMGKAPKIPMKRKKHVTFLKFWPEKNGILKSIKGYKKIIDMPFVVEPKQNAKIGDKVGLSKLGNSAIVTLYLVANTQEELLGYIRKAEKLIKFELV